MILFGGHCSRQAGRERTDGFPSPSQGGTAQELTANPVVPVHMLHLLSWWQVPSIYTLKHTQTEPKNLPEVL